MAQKGNLVIYISLGVLVLIILGLGYHFLTKSSSSTSNQIINTNNQSSTMQPIPSPAASSTTDGLSNKSNTSDAQLDKDFQDVQGSMNKLNTDVTTSNQDTSNQDVPQSQ